MADVQEFGLCGGSLAGADLRTLAECAGKAGFRSIGIWPSHFEAALAGGLSVADLRAVLSDNGVAISELDPLCTWLPVDPDDGGIAAPFYRYSEDDFFRVADALGARSLNVIQASNAPVARDAVVEALASLCERAARHGLVVSVEFMAWTPICDLDAALELVRAVGRADCGVNVDTWHHFRTGGSHADLECLAPGDVAAVQLSDVEPEPWEDVLRETARARKLPGEGAGTAAGVLAAYERAGVEAPINVEVFSDELRRLDAARAAAALARSVERLVAGRG